MATLELEPDFVKGLRFMFSTSRDAPDALRAMLDEAIRAKYGTSKSLGTFLSAKIKVEEEEDFGTALTIPEQDSEDTASSKEDDDNVLDLEMMEEDLACAVCRGMNIGPRNRLVECVECKTLYHQECHKPVIMDQEISDPRQAWYCATCKHNMQRASAPLETSSKQSSSKSSSSKQSTFKSSSSSRDSPTNSKPSSSRSESSSQSLFKRADKSNNSSSSSSSHKNAPSGLAALAASLQPSSKPSSSSHKSSSGSSSGNKSSSTSGSSSSTKGSSSHSSFSSSSKNSSGGSSSQTSKGSPSSPTLSGLNADRRLQNMKKKAAAKIQEKRSKHSK